ncbi:hypothetical protein HanRHA438_Chr01g0002801 [Helianthus annuus]|nr:hypothetical protein HanRHA438_Chr01g0002801 [Helianthus annuus]
MSAWGRGEADVFGLQIFRKTNKLQSSNICARLRNRHKCPEVLLAKKQTPPKWL